ncbi:MAG TPA: SGNH/GDSL hydrolase family protein [Isosphaeraceae bacterium]|nr:SGNH/GDSL hydrolase family protein [Isosphaeraceae bacterium]
MRKLRAFRPEGVDGLEERLVLSYPAAARAVLHTAAVQVASLRATAHSAVPLGPVGTLGDSFTDEYRFYPPDRTQARGWVEILAATREINFGPFSHRSRGEPRDSGFAYDWARSDSTTADMVRSQLPGLAAQVARGQVKDVVILDGGNDYLLPLKAVGAGTLDPAAYAAALPATTAQAGANITTAVTTLLASSPNVHLVISTIDISDLPIVRGLAALSPALEPLVQAVDQAVGSYNGVIRGLASSSPRVALVDLAAIDQQLSQVPGGSVPFGGTTINLATVGNDYHDFFLADGLHPGTVAQGIIADLFLNAFNDHFGTAVRPLSPAEIVRYAARVQYQIRHNGPRA